MALLSFLSRAMPSNSQSSEMSAILREISPDVRRWVSRHLGPRSDLDDAVQEALIDITQGLAQFRGESSLRTYAHRIAIRSAWRYSQRHRNARRVQQLHVALDVDSLTPEALAMQRESLRRLYVALDSLSEKRRSAFVLCAIEKMSHDEAASIEEVSVDTLRARLKHARADLESALRNDPYLGSLFKETER